VQGLGDEEIPPERALELSDAISGRDVIITYVKYGKHGLDDFEDDFRRIFYFIEDIEQQVTVWISLSLSVGVCVCVCVCVTRHVCCSSF
jgi:hypothetical protein